MGGITRSDAELQPLTWRGHSCLPRGDLSPRFGLEKARLSARATRSTIGRENAVPRRAFRFPLTIFLSAVLLFQMQPIMGRFVLPWFGGGPAVWTDCLLFFQALLLAGYAYAHWLGSRRNARLQGAVHVSLLAASLLFLPIGPHAAYWKPTSSGDPSGHILLLLAATAGGPYLLLSATAPLLQRWFTLSESGRAPWRLYALSNFGSFLALLSYPFVVEPILRLSTQVWIWSALYAVFAVCCGWTAWRFRSSVQAVPAIGKDDSASRPPIWTVVFWVALGACGSVLLMASTNQISQEIAVNPFLWVAPLSVYLLTFVLAFEKTQFYHRVVFAVAAGVLAPAGCVVLSVATSLTLVQQLSIYLLVLFVTCMVCNGELARARPSPRYLTTFYLAIAAGGALGGVLVALLAPHMFTEFDEYPLGLAAACLLGLVGWLRSGALAQWTGKNFAVRIPLMALLLGGITSVVAMVSLGNQPALASKRNFYGILRVIERADGEGGRRELRHGRILHGFQYLQEWKRTWATSYYGPHSGAALTLNSFERPNRRVGIVGLGAGTLAAWGRPGDTFRFYEINPDVESLARTWFSFLKDSKARTEVVLGDARVQLERELADGHEQDFDMMAVDAFSSDAIPVHLLTAECARVYQRHLAPGGLLLLHVSNRVLNLEPVARGLAGSLGWKAVMLVSPDNNQTGESAADWVLITANTDFLKGLGVGQTVGRSAAITWTDDFASLWHVAKF